MTANQRKFDPEINYYEVLDVSYSASRSEITRAYRELMRHAHPDRHVNGIDRTKAEERAKLLNAAYAVLGKPDIRREYDQTIKQKAVSDAVFQRYTGNVPGSHGPQRPRRRPVDAAMRRAQTRANRSAFIQIMLFAAIFAIIVIAVIVGGSLVGQGIDQIF